jgi:small ligand-binding sensory domain FIST
MRWASALTEERATEAAVEDAAARVEPGLAGAKPDLVLLFTAPEHEGALARVRARFPGAVVVGCSAGGVIGGGRESEGNAALSLAVASLPGVDLDPLRLDDGDIPDLSPPACFVVLADPFTCDVDRLVSALDARFPGVPKIGGMASGGRQPGATVLHLADETLHDGAVALALRGNLTAETVVAQGCRPIGTPLVITRCEKNVVEELGGRPALKVLRELFDTLSAEDKTLFRSALHVGIEMSGERIEYKAGDFLVRNVLGADPESGAIAIGALPERYQALQFHLRDAKTAHQDLAACLDRFRAETGATRPAGGLLFSCLGRGAQLYGKPNHDSDLFRERIGPTPLGGFFCNGEIGPVGGQTFVHGYTSSFGLFRPGRS